MNVIVIKPIEEQFGFNNYLEFIIKLEIPDILIPLIIKGEIEADFLERDGLTNKIIDPITEIKYFSEESFLQITLEKSRVSAKYELKCLRNRYTKFSHFKCNEEKYDYIYKNLS